MSLKFNQFVTIIFGLLVAFTCANLQAQTIVTYQLHDALGTPVVGTDDQGNVLWRRHYEPFGAELASEGDTTHTVTQNYTGHAYDDSLDLVNMGARFYDPQVGLFMGWDPASVSYDNPYSFNRYAYANQNPYKYIDPDGRLPLLIPVAMFIAKEVAAEAASRATGGLTDFLSVRKMAQKGVVHAAKAIAKNKSVTEDVAKNVKVSRSKYPESAKHIEDAQAAGHPKTLTIDRAGAAQNRKESLRGIPTKAGSDRDEYPPAMFKEGGSGASVRHIKSSDNQGSGASIGGQCRGLDCGTKVRIDVVD